MRENVMWIQMASQELDDTAMKQWCSWAKQHVPKKGKPKKVTLDLSGNEIGAEGIAALISALSVLKLPIHELRLHKNKLGSEGACMIAKLLKQGLFALQELHLSHNDIDQKGAEAIIEAVASAGQEGRPLYPVMPD